MRPALLIGTALIGLSLAASPAPAQNDAKGMDKVDCPKAVAGIADCYSAKLETGAYLLAAMPKNWNGSLIVFAHGGPSTEPPQAKDSLGNLNRYAFGVKAGYAWIASTYRREGYSIAMAAADTEDARQFFVAHFSKPKTTILHGASYGGMVGAKLLETYAKNADGTPAYDGALFNSGAVGGPIANYEFRADLRVVYQYYCMNLPKPDEVQYPLWMGLPLDSKMTLKEVTARIDECTGVTKPAGMRSERQKQNLANIVGVMRIPESMLVRHMQAATLLFRDLNERFGHGKSVFSNVGVKYRGASDDAALNSGVARFEADPAAVQRLRADGTPTGALTVPVVSIHSLNDPQAAVEAQYEYREAVQKAGNGALLVQAYTDEPSHTGQSDPELLASLNALTAWIGKGTKPDAETIAAGCKALQAGIEGPCRWHPEYRPKPLSTRFARGR